MPARGIEDAKLRACTGKKSDIVGSRSSMNLLKEKTSRIVGRHSSSFFLLILLNKEKSLKKYLKIQTKKKLLANKLGALNEALGLTYSHMGSPTLPSALLRFTSEFGMGSGGSIALFSPGKLACA